MFSSKFWKQWAKKGCLWHKKTYSDIHFIVVSICKTLLPNCVPLPWHWPPNDLFLPQVQTLIYQLFLILTQWFQLSFWALLSGQISRHIVSWVPPFDLLPEITKGDHCFSSRSLYVTSPKRGVLESITTVNHTLKRHDWRCMLSTYLL